MSKTVPFQTIQFSLITQFSSIWHIDRTPSGVSTPVDLEAMLMKGYSLFPEAPALLLLYDQIVYCHIKDARCGVLPHCKGAVGAFYSPSRLGNPK